MLKVIDEFIDRKIGQVLLAENAEEQKNHISSGKLSASQLGDPLQWQILKAMGTPTTPFDEYVLRKFKRGKDIEKWVLQFLKTVAQEEGKQDFVVYRDTVGYLDAMCDTSDWDFKHGIIPVEVKSVSNAKYKRVVANGPDRSHVLQASFYAIAKGSTHTSVLYVASDDLRVRCYIIEVNEKLREEIENIITKFQTQLATGEIPVFQAIEAWQANDKYCRYLEYRDKTKEQLLALKK